MITQRKLVYFSALCFTLATIIACQSQQPAPPQVDIGEELAFENIDAAKDTDIGGSGYPDQQPATYILWEYEDIAQVEDWITATALAQLKEILATTS
ncbi:MAG: hypothetical protein IT328_24185 [Caldilineaceae bacterium]|nr:hypothetical protein [Caldilineaceae bacterium]